MVLCGYLGAIEMKIMLYHIQRGMPQYLLQREYITAIQQVVGGKCMPAEVGM